MIRFEWEYYEKNGKTLHTTIKKLRNQGRPMELLGFLFFIYFILLKRKGELFTCNELIT